VNVRWHGSRDEVHECISDSRGAVRFTRSNWAPMSVAIRGSLETEVLLA
jgi:hypothetical protein